jgi:hypothetical protein
MGMATADESTLPAAGICKKLVAHEATAYKAEPMAEYTTSTGTE